MTEWYFFNKHALIFFFFFTVRNDDGAHPSLRDRGEDAPADHGGVSVELQVIQQQARGQQHGRGVGGVVVGDALAGVPGSLQIEEHA